MSVWLYGLLFAGGGAVYMLLECLWRGRTHISMGITGGAAAALLVGLYLRMGAGGYIAKLVCGMAVITALEFICGAVVNVRLQKNVWDYSAMPYQLYGQVCLGYSLLWGGLALVLAWVAEGLRGIL
ncbi:MAG: hypothetical protein PHO41_06960 [Eubacteriales bacterium]|nr:hypothetical protein [Eubacteriales bacterium]